ncbi:MAG: hypothetical protein MJY47_00790 [Fibrobacter sp.]|nr:hypothetical protein [Fibrobacter sp.]
MKKQWMCLLLCAGLVTFASARKFEVTKGDASDLATAAKNAVAGDTILVPPGTYKLDTDICQSVADSFKGDGRDKGCLWVGGKSDKRTTKDNPIMIVGTDPANPPDIIGPGTGSNYYTAHITENYVYFKNLKLSQGSKVLIIDYAQNVIVEDCELTGSGTELLHVRDSSQNVVINRNFIHGSGHYTGMYGEGVYVGTYPGSWYTRNSDDRAKLKTPDNYGYDWRVNGTQITCNVIKATTAEPIDVKEGVDGVRIAKNMFVADWLATESGAPSYDDAYIDMKGRNAVVDSNYMYDSKDASLLFYNPKFKYFVEEVANKDANAVAWEEATGIKVRPDGYTSTGWCDNSASDNNKCFAASNNVVKEIRDVRNDCDEILSIPGGSAITYSDVDFAAADEIRLTPGGSSSSSTPGSSSSNSGGTTKTTYYEAESAEHGTGEVKSHADAHGGSYVIVKDQNVTFTVNVPTTGSYDVLVRFSNTAQNAKTQTIQVNGSKLMDKEFPVTLEGNVGGANAKFEEVTIPMNLNAGSNKIAFIKNWGYVDLDCIAITTIESPTPTKTTRYEAESASHGTAEVKTHKDASNGSYVFVKDQDVVFNVNVATAGTYDVLVRFSNTASNAKTQTIQVNGTKVMDKEFPVTLEGNVGGANAKFEDMVLSLSLKAGSNTIGFIKNWGYVDLDYIEITENAAAIFAKRAPMNFRATVQGRLLQIQSATVGAAYAVMDMQGRVVKSGSIGAASMVLPMPASGNYLVRVGSQIQRISVK